MAAIGLILASAFPAIVVYAQDLVPGKVGMISGLFFGFAFGVGGLGAAVLGVLADHIGLERVYDALWPAAAAGPVRRAVAADRAAARGRPALTADGVPGALAAARLRLCCAWAQSRRPR